MTDETTAISATRRQYKEMADGTLRVQIDIDPQFKQRFLELFGQIDMPVALAPLKADFEKPKEKPKGGPLSQEAAKMCDRETFQQFLLEKYDHQWGWWMQSLKSPVDIAAACVRNICAVESRADLDHNREAANRFRDLMREYHDWCQVR